MSPIDRDSASVQSYVSILQNIISRLASNSTACKTWCITVVSAIIVIIADKGKPEYIWISVVPLVLLFFLDSYYLGMERTFRILYNSFVKKLNDNTAEQQDIFVIAPITGFAQILLATMKAAGSVSIWPFYGLLTVMLVIVKTWIL